MTREGSKGLEGLAGRMEEESEEGVYVWNKCMNEIHHEYATRNIFVYNNQYFEYKINIHQNTREKKNKLTGH